MKVFLAFKPDYDNNTIYGVFSTVELAQAACGESTADWEGDGEDGWYRPEVQTEPLRIEWPNHELGWSRSYLISADAGYIQALDLDTPAALPTQRDVVTGARPMTEQDETEWAAYMARQRAAGLLFSTTTVNIHSTG